MPVSGSGVELAGQKVPHGPRVHDVAAAQVREVLKSRRYVASTYAWKPAVISTSTPPAYFGAFRTFFLKEASFRARDSVRLRQR